jgi:3-dehydroquinate dehydratase / shikimate dehydrogenase
MICVSLGRPNHQQLIADHRALAERGAQLVELRLDWLEERPDVARLLAGRPTPVVVTCRRAQDKGLWRFSEEERLAVLKGAIQAGAEYVDLEEDVAAQFPRQGPTKRIISQHDFEKTPDDLSGLHARLCARDPDLVKLVTMAHAPLDNVRILKIVAGAKVPTIGFCMGEFGIPSRVLTGRYGAPFTYCTFDKAQTLAPGQLQFEEMRDLYRYDQIDAQTGIYGVVADPVGHSLSPLIHNSAFREQGLNNVYLPFRVPKDRLAETIREFEWLGVRGYSVTIPHKEAAVQITSRYDGPVREIGAANTLYRDASNQWRAANTDHEAALESLVQALMTEVVAEAAADDADARSIRKETTAEILHGKRVLMLGAGGVARAIGMGVVKSGARLTIVNRTPQRAHDLAAELGATAVPWDERGDAAADIIVNCTSVGMHPRVDETPYEGAWFRPGTLVFDTIYNPEETRLLREAREHGCPTVNGIEMFVRQAGRQYEYFTGRKPPLETMREALRREIAARSAR